MTDEERSGTADGIDEPDGDGHSAPPDYEAPTGAARLASSLIDSLVAGLFVSLVSSGLIAWVIHPAKGAKLTLDQQRSALWLEVVALSLGALMFVLLERLGGASIGKRAMRIRLVGPDGRKPSWGRLVLKYVSTFFLLVLGILGLLLVLAGLTTATLVPQRRNAFDLLAGTKPIAVPRPLG